MAMIEITFSADAEMLDRAEQIAKEKGTTFGERDSAMAGRLRHGKVETLKEGRQKP